MGVTFSITTRGSSKPGLSSVIGPSPRPAFSKRTNQSYRTGGRRAGSRVRGSVPHRARERQGVMLPLLPEVLPKADHDHHERPTTKNPGEAGRGLAKCTTDARPFNHKNPKQEPDLSTSGTQNKNLLHILAAAEAGRVVVVVATVRRGAIAATLAVLEGVHEEPADERAGRIGDPFVEIADEVEDARLG